MYSLEKAQLFSLKDVCRVYSIYYLFLLQFPALWSPVMTGRFCLDWIMAVKICGSPSPDRVQSPHQSPGDPLTSLTSPVVTYANLFTRREQMSRVGQQSKQRQQYSTGHNPSQCQQISLIHIIQNHIKTLLQLLNMTPESPTNNNQINAPMLSMSQQSDGVTSPGGVVSLAWCLSADDPNSTILSPHETCFIIPALP